MKLKILFISILFCAIIISCTNKKKPEASKTDNLSIYFNGEIITMEGDQPEYVETVVEREGTIIFVGNKADAIKTYPDATPIDLKGKTMVPGFIDGHGHFYNTGFVSIVANLLPPPDGPCGNIQQVVDAAKKWKDTEEGKFVVNKFGWIIGHGYDDSQLKEKDHPKATDLDKISTEYPVILVHQSEHLGVVNSKALELAGFTKDTKDPEGGHLRRNPDGSPNGVLEEKALYAIIFPLLGKGDEEYALKCIEKSQKQYASNGYMTIQDGRTTAEVIVKKTKVSVGNGNI